MHEGRVLNPTLAALDHFCLLFLLLLFGLCLVLLYSLSQGLHLVLLLGRLLVLRCRLLILLRSRLSLLRRCDSGVLRLVLLVLRLEHFLHPDITEYEQNSGDDGREKTNYPEDEHAVARLLELALVENVEEHALQDYDKDQSDDPLHDIEYPGESVPENQARNPNDEQKDSQYPTDKLSPIC